MRALIFFFAIGTSDPIRTTCPIKKIRITGAQMYEGYNWSKKIMKSLGHFNGVYEIESEMFKDHNTWTKQRPDSRSVSLQWTDDIFGATGWILTNKPGQPRFFTYSIDDCPHTLGDWQLLEYGNKTVVGNEKSADSLVYQSLGDFKPVPSWVLAQLDDQPDSDIDQPETPVEDIFTMLAHLVPEKLENLYSYGCTGLSDLRLFSTPGIRADSVDMAINKWKKCVSCAQDVLGATADPYMFDTSSNQCLNTSGNVERALCDCDFALASTLRNLEVKDKRLSSKDCFVVKPSANQQCCFNLQSGLFAPFNTQISCCSREGTVESIGTC